MLNTIDEDCLRPYLTQGKAMHTFDYILPTFYVIGSILES